MSRQESARCGTPTSIFVKKTKQSRQPAWQEYLDQEDATRLKTARLRAERPARDATAAGAEMLLPKPNSRTRGKKR